ncbi:MAG TPA: hypothetical protein VNM36_08955 [Gemmatimonadaceae bacterium]|jgi:hypothetical protein|nr:hypothetical protein [Gemmatimonadaceae bacterium]
MPEDIAIIDIIAPPTSVIEVATGVKGDTGPPGPPGGSSSVFFYRVDAQSTAANDPGAGKIRYNTVVQVDATSLYVDWLTAEGFDAHVLFSLLPVTRLLIQDKDLAVHYQVFDITGPVIEYPDWFEVPVAFVAGSGSADFSHNQNIAVALLTGEGATLPTAPLGQVLSSQGDGADPVFLPHVLLINPTGPAGQRRWQISSTGTDFVIDCQNDAGVSAGRKVYISAFNGGIALSPGASFDATGGGVIGGFLRLVPSTVAGHNGHRVLGMLVNIEDSTVNTPGAVIAGGGTFGVLARWNGSNWIVIGG